MIRKQVLPESFDFGMPAVDIVNAGSRGLDKRAMVKRAAAFDDVLGSLPVKKGRTYLHVITTGAYEKYGPNMNGDGYNGESFDLVIPAPEKGGKKVIKLDGGLSKYHDDSYMGGDAFVYQEHKTKREGVDPSGEIVCARYNPTMQRGELLIAVDTDKWSKRLQRKSEGHDIYLSIGCDVPRDICTECGREAHTMAQHCDHFNRMRGMVMDDGVRVCVMNDTPKFYDISGVDVPADKIAFVLQKVASGAATEREAVNQAFEKFGARKPMPLNKAAAILGKLSRMEKRIGGLVEADSDVFEDEDEAKDDFLSEVDGYPAEEVIDCCNRKGLLLTPEMLFRLLGKEAQDGDGKVLLISCGDGCCGDMSHLMQDCEDDDGMAPELLDGMFDQHYPLDLNLASIVDSFMGEFGVTDPAIRSKTITITIRKGTGAKSGCRGHRKRASADAAEDALKRTYARYVISFASQNDDSTCFNALRKLAHMSK